MLSVAEKKLSKIKEDARVNVQHVLVLPEDPSTYVHMGTRVCKDGSMIHCIKLNETVV